MVTALPQIILGLTSADCAIVLFADVEAQVIGVAHAGWRGAKQGVLEATVAKMRHLGASPSHMVAAISPCIAQASYEVDHTFYQAFLAEEATSDRQFKPAERANRWLFDLSGYIEARLMRLQLKTISTTSTFDTYTDEARFFSCRRAMHRGETSFGCQLSCILIL